VSNEDAIAWLQGHEFTLYRHADAKTQKVPPYFVLVDEGASGGRRGILQPSIAKCVEEAVRNRKGAKRG
jgi:hypothetical protein